MTKGPIHEIHQGLGASFGDVGGWEMPLSYAEGIEAEYRSAMTAVGLFDRSHHGRVALGGKDGLALLHRLCTNAVDDLVPGDGTTTALLNNRGRIIDYMAVLKREGDALLITNPSAPKPVIDWLRKHVFFRDEVELIDLTDELGMLGLAGPRSAEVLEDLGVADARDLTLWGHVTVPIGSADVLVARADPVAGESYILAAPVGAMAKLWTRLIVQGADYDLAPAGCSTWEVLRVEAGLGAYGHEVSEDFHPLEAGLEGAVSMAKGCYLGQEVIARIIARQRLKSGLVGIVFTEGTAPEVRSRLLAKGKGVGTLTSVVTSPALGQPIGLAIVKDPYRKIGTRLAVGETEMEGEVAALPFAVAATT
jgi:glycine cleavage system T protein